MIPHRYRVLGAATLAVCLLGAWAVWHAVKGMSEAAMDTQAPVPVRVGQVVRRDVPQLTAGIGTVQSLHTVTIRSQVDGVLTEILFREGQQVKSGDLLARIDDRSIAAALDEARAEKARNQAQLESGQRDLARYQRLLRDKSISQQVVDQQAALVQQLEAAVAANEAAIAAEGVQLSYTRITSPVTGRTGMRRVDPGNLVRAGDSQGLVVVSQIDPIAVVFSLPQELLPRIQALMAAPDAVPVEARDRDGGEIIGRGELTLIDNQIDPATGTIRLKAEFPNPGGRLWPGQFVSVQLRTGMSRQAVVAPVAAVQRGLDEDYVYRLEGSRVQLVKVRLGYEDEDQAVIETGLSPGDTVITDGQSRLQPGVAVRVVNGAD